MQSFREMWIRATLVQRVTLLGGLFGAAVIVFLLFQWVSKPSLSLLYRDLAPDDAAKIVQKIEDADIPYELKNGGTTIYVAREKVNSLRLTMASHNLPSGSPDSDFSEKSEGGFGTDPEVARQRLLRSKERSLANSIMVIDGVQTVRVHIVPEKKSAFRRTNGKQASASVMLHLRSGFRISSKTANTIAYLVSTAVRGLLPENVTIADSKGNSYTTASRNSSSGAFSRIHEQKLAMERQSVEKINELLSRVLGVGMFTVQASVVLETTATQSESKVYDAGVLIKETKKDRKDIKGAIAGNSTGGNGNNSRSTPPTDSNKESTVEFMPGVTLTKTSTIAGTRKSISVAAMVDLSGLGESDDSGAKLTVEDIKKQIATAVGATPADKIEVINTTFLPVAQAEEIEESASSGNEFYLEIARRLSLGLLVIGALLALKIVAGKKKGAGQSAGPESLPGVAPGGGALPSQPQPPAGTNQLTNLIQSNPEPIKAMFKTWAQGEGGN